MTRLAVLGDLIIDRYIYFSSLRLSPEAPAPVVKRCSEQTIMGGAGNVALSLRNLGNRVDLYYPLSDQSRVDSNMVSEGLSEIGLFPLRTDNPGIPAIKTRYYVDGRQFMREDEEDFAPGRKPVSHDALCTQLSDYAVVVLSDYRKGCFRADSLRIILSYLKGAGIAHFLDTKATDPSLVAGCFCLKVNYSEFRSLCTHPNMDLTVEFENLQIAMKRFTTSYHIRHLFVTLGDRGSAYANADGMFVYEDSSKIDVIDITGAGDAFLAAIVARFLARSGNQQVGLGSVSFQASDLRFANMASASVLTCSGTTPIPKTFITDSTDGELSNAKRVGFTNGCFDILHAGHIELLRFARSMCDHLIVGLNSDASVTRLKGASRPINSQSDRQQLLLALSFVDEVIVFDEDTPLGLIKSIRPHILVKGSDYRPEEIVGASDVMAYGGSVITYPILPGYSTSSILNKAHGSV